MTMIHPLLIAATCLAAFFCLLAGGWLDTLLTKED